MTRTLMKGLESYSYLIQSSYCLKTFLNDRRLNDESAFQFNFRSGNAQEVQVGPVVTSRREKSFLTTTFLGSLHRKEISGGS